MSILLSIVEGWTGLLGPFTLRVDGDALDLTGLTVELRLHNAAGAVVVPGGTVTILDQVTNKGQVTYSPVAEDFTLVGGTLNPVRQSYATHWRVSDVSGEVVYFPNGAADEIVVHRA